MTFPVRCSHCDRRFGEIESVTGVCIKCLTRVVPLGPLPADDDSQERALRRNRTVWVLTYGPANAGVPGPALTEPGTVAGPEVETGADR